MKTKINIRGVSPRNSIRARKWAIINSKISPKMKHFYTLALCLLSFGGFSQINVADTLAFYQSEYGNGNIGFHSLDSTLGDFFNALPEDERYTRYHKEYQRSMAFWRDRVEYNASGESLAGAYTRALSDYLDSPTCSNGDKAHWQYAFDPSPILDGETLDTNGLCTFTGDHTAGIVRSIYMHPVVNNLILAGSNSAGIWRTTNGGVDWECVTDNLGIPALGVFDIVDVSKPSEPVGSVLLAVTGKIHFHDSFGVGVLRSTNGGESWTRHDIPLNDAGLMSPLRKITKPYAENDSVFAMSNNNIFYSTNRGISWSEMTSIPSLVGAKNYYGLSSTYGTENIIYVSSFGTSAKIWRTNAGDIDWEEITPAVLSARHSCLDVEIAESFDFETGLEVLTTNTHLDTLLSGVSDDTIFQITSIDIDADEHLYVPPLTFHGPTPPTRGGLALFYEFDETTRAGDISIACNARIPFGAKIEFYIVNDPDELVYDERFAPEDGTLIGQFDTDDIDGIVAYSETFTVTEPGFMTMIAARFSFIAPDFGYTDTTPIIFDDWEFDFSRSGSETIPTAIGISVANGDELNLALQDYDTTLNKKRISILNSTNKGITWNCVGISSGFSGIGSEGDRLASRDNFVAGYGTEEGYYFGGVKFIRYDTELEDLYQVCSQHDDVRAIQIVKNVDGNNHLVVGDDGGVAYSEDNGMTWTSRNGNNLPITQFYDFALNPHDNVSVLGGTQDNGTFFSDQVGEWSMIGNGDGNSNGFSPDPTRNGQRYFQINNRTVVQELSGGDWVEVYEASSAGEGYSAYLGRPSTYSPSTGNAIYEGAKGDDDVLHPNAVIIKHDLNPTGGYDDPYVYDFDGFDGTSVEIGAIEVAPNNEQVIYAAEGYNRSALEFSKLFVSVDQGITYSDLSASSTADILDEDGITTSKSLADILSYKHPNTIETNPEDFTELWIGISGVNRIDGEVVGGIFRVLHSSDTGNTWQDYSLGLPPFPVNDLIYQRATNDRLFAATDVGIFYRDASMDQWECFQEGMPATFANDLEINYCQQALYAGTFGRGIWSSFIDMPDTEPIVVDTNLTWGGVQQFENDIFIESGNTLTLNGTLEMAGGKKVIVEQGAQLIVDGGTITSLCDVFWGGIEVWGDKDEIQVPHSNQGKVILKNNALIEHARIGIATWKNGDYNSTGGLIFASSSTFKNNKKDVEFRAYQNYNGSDEPLGNKSFFTNMTFTWDDDFRAEYPLGHVTMYRVDGIQFKGCLFEDARTTPLSAYHDNDYSVRNSGIYTIDAQFYVAPICTDGGGCSGGISDDPDWTPSIFQNLDFGIYATNSTTERNITVDRSVFENNLYGVELINVNSPIVTRNEFTINNDSTNNFLDHAEYGVHAVRSKGVKVEENKFTHLTGDNDVYGIVCSDLGESDEEIYNNYFEGMKFGITTQGKNRDLDGLDGLKFFCDSNVTNYKDHLVLGTLWGDTISPIYGVKRISGADDYPSGNIFSTLPLATDEEHYDNVSDNEVFYYHRQFDVPETPTDYSGLFTPLAIDFENICPSKLEDNGTQGHTSSTLQTFKSDFGMIADDLDIKEATYQSLVNGGNTDSLMTEIDNLIVANREQLRSLLNNNSPYLTREAVEATIDNPISKYPHAWAYELIVDNIEVAYEDGFIDFLSTKAYPMEQWMIDDIKAELDSGLTTDMLVKQSELAQLRSEKAYLANVIVQSYKNDTLLTDMDSIRHWIQQEDEILAETRIIDAYIQEGDFTTAQSKVNTLNTAIQTYPIHLQDELTDYVSFKNKVIAILSANSEFDNLAVADHTFLTDLANDGEGIARYQAQELLCFYYDECAEYPVVTMQVGGGLSPSFEQDKPKSETQSFAVYPNPANNWVTIVLPESDLLMNVTIVDLTGRVIFNQLIDRSLFIWDTELVGNGTYLITITNENQTESLGTQKVVVQH
ncbi:MAG: T9SS type A sorting domain-containing protein [Crocinitomix sp.]|nr:T9SS type A sorting domain-containing protein [Crocinitomix sp.]